MNWNDHSKLEGQHAPFSASGYQWLNYTPEKLVETYRNMQAKQKGTEDHEFAALCIKNRRKLQARDALAKHVNDAIGFKMAPEVLLYYSKYFFGTTDAIVFRKNTDKNFPDCHYELRIHDLKTGRIPVKGLHQLEIYAALFFLEYKIDPFDTKIELRIYQADNYITGNPTGKDIKPIMDKIVYFDGILNKENLMED